MVKIHVVWILALAFAAHTFIFYGFTAWLPSLLSQSIGMSASESGAAASLFQILGMLGCFGLPMMESTGFFPIRVRFLTVTLSWILTTAGILFAPKLWIVWTIFGGIGSGGVFTVIFGLIMAYAQDLDQNRRMSTLVQSAGYMVASLSPFVIGHIHEYNGKWNLGLAVLTAAGLIMTLCGLSASSCEHVN